MQNGKAEQPAWKRTANGTNKMACFPRATQMRLAVNHNTSITSFEWIQCWKRIARASEIGSCQSNLGNSWGYELLRKSKDSLKDCFENVNNCIRYMVSEWSRRLYCNPTAWRTVVRIQTWQFLYFFCHFPCQFQKNVYAWKLRSRLKSYDPITIVLETVYLHITM